MFFPIFGAHISDEKISIMTSFDMNFALKWQILCRKMVVSPQETPTSLLGNSDFPGRKLPLSPEEPPSYLSVIKRMGNGKISNDDSEQT